MDTLGKGEGKEKASPAEKEKLIEEMRRLIKEKGLDGVELIAPEPKEPILRGCARCTICPCMICW